MIKREEEKKYKLQEHLLLETAPGKGAMSGRSLCTQRAPRNGTRCEISASALGARCKEHPPVWGHPRLPQPGTMVPTMSTLHAGSGEAQTKQLSKFNFNTVRRRLSADGINTGFTASSTVCHRFCSALSDANIENNVIVARIFGLGLPGQSGSAW